MSNESSQFAAILLIVIGVVSVLGLLEIVPPMNSLACTIPAVLVLAIVVFSSIKITHHE